MVGQALAALACQQEVPIMRTGLRCCRVTLVYVHGLLSVGKHFTLHGPTKLATFLSRYALCWYRQGSP